MSKKEISEGVWAHCFDAPIMHDNAGEIASEHKIGTLALLVSDLRVKAKFGNSVAIAQFYGLLQEKMLLTEHIFRGLKRPLLAGGDKNGSAIKLVYSRRAAYDWDWVGDKHSGQLQQVDAPKGCVFCVFVSPNIKHRQTYPNIDGWINHWAWIDEDLGMPGAPENWNDRFDDGEIWGKE